MKLHSYRSCWMCNGYLNPHEAFNASLGALYGPLVIYMMPASVHRTVMKALKNVWNWSPLFLGKYLELNLQRYWRVKVSKTEKRSAYALWILAAILDGTQMKVIVCLEQEVTYWNSIILGCCLVCVCVCVCLCVCVCVCVCVCDSSWS